MKRLRVLVVEDHDDLRELLIQVLSLSGYEVNEADSADAALAVAADWPFDVAIIDIGLPRKNGLQLMRELRKLREVVAVALTGYGQEADVRACRDAGFAAHLLKPVEAQTLLDVLRRLKAA